MAKVIIDDRIDWIQFYSERLSSPPRPAGDHKYNACCPFHDEKNPSFWFNTTNGMWKCESGCGSGNATTFLARMENIDNKEAWKKLCKIAGVEEPMPTPALPLTLTEYATDKHLPIEFLVDLGLESKSGYQNAHREVPAYVAIPYYDKDGALCATKRRMNVRNKPRFEWDKGGKITLYGAWLDLNKKSKGIVLVEGESDAQSCWLHNLPALGVPGASNFQSAWVSSMIGDRDVYLHVERDNGGATFRKKTLQNLYDAGFRGRAFCFSCHDANPDCKDPSDLHIKYGDQFREKIDEMIRGAKQVDIVDECMTVHQATPVTKSQSKPIQKLTTYHASELYDMRLERPPIIVSGMVPAGLTVLAGAPKRGKSWLALSMAINVSAGDPFLGQKTTQGDVLYLDLESRQYRVKDRLSNLIPGRAPEALQIAHESARLEGGLIEQLTMWANEAPHPVLIIIDTLGRVKGAAKRGENAYEGDTRILGELQSFALQHKLAVVCVHHLRKSTSDGDYFERISGSMGITGACDSVMVLQGKRGEAESTLSVSGRDFEAAEIVLAFDGGRWKLCATNSVEYQNERDYITSELVRSVIKLAEIYERWEGTPRELLDEILSLGVLSTPLTPTRMSCDLQPFQRMLCERDNVLINWSRHASGRKITIRRAPTDGF